MDGSYVFGANQGLIASVDGLDLSDFSIEFELQVNVMQFPFAKLLDFSNLTEDRGFYRNPTGNVFEKLPPVGPISSGAIPLGVPTTVRLARDGSTRLLSGWINGVITFFADDAVNHYVETCSGSVAWIRIGSSNAR